MDDSLPGSPWAAGLAMPAGFGDKSCSDPVDESLQSKERLRWERRCIERVLSGEASAFGELYREYAPLLFSRILMPRLGNRAAAEDALAETFRTGLEKLHQFDPRKVSVYFWFARIAGNKAMDMHRVKARTSRALTNFEGLLAPLLEHNPEPGTAAERQQEASRLQQRVQQVLSMLNPRYRRTLELRLLEERPRLECAELLEVKIGTFDVLLLRALKAFRREWSREAAEESTP